MGWTAYAIVYIFVVYPNPTFFSESVSFSKDTTHLDFDPDVEEEGTSEMEEVTIQRTVFRAD